MKRQTLIAVCAVALALLIAGDPAAAARLEIGGASALKGAHQTDDHPRASANAASKAPSWLIARRVA